MTHTGDVDVAGTAALFGDRTRARILVALADGRALAAGMLAAEAGVSPQAASAQLERLRAGGLVVGERSGRHRYYRLASERVAGVLEALSGLAAAEPVTSLRQGTRAAALRRARTCYDHLAGQLGCAVTDGLVRRGVLARDDGERGTGRRAADRLSAPVRDHPYLLGPRAQPVLAELGVDLAGLRDGRRPLLRFCVDWSEQRHHLAGALGAAVLDALRAAGWVESGRHGRAVRLSAPGRDGLADVLEVEACTDISAS